MAHVLQWETRLLQLGNDLSAHVFFPTQSADQTIEVEWSLNDVTSWVWMSSHVEKRREKNRSNKDRIEATYGRMYGKTRPEPRQCLNQKNKSHDDVWKNNSDQRVGRCLSFALSNPDFGQEQAFRINSLFFRLLAHVCQVNSFRGKLLSLLCLGGEGQKVQVPVGGFVSSAAVWPGGVRSVLEDVCGAAWGDPKRPWYRSTCEKISIPEFIMFGLDAMSSRTFPSYRLLQRMCWSSCLNCSNLRLVMNVHVNLKSSVVLREPQNRFEKECEYKGISMHASPLLLGRYLWQNFRKTLLSGGWFLH